MVKFSALAKDSLSLLLCLGLILANGCDRFDSSAQALRLNLSGRETLRVASLNNHPQLQRKLNRGVQWGLAYDLFQNLTNTADIKLEWKIVKNESLGQQLLQQGQVDLLVSRNSLPLAEGVQFGPSPSKDLFFYIASSDSQLLQALDTWNQQIALNGVLNEAQDLYPHPSQVLSSSDFKLFKESVRRILPIYIKTFKKYSAELSIPWQLTAAISFQESHWNANARSYTGVRGLMMLTEKTAEVVNVTDRRDPEQSIHGGAKYIHYLMGLVEEKTLNSNPTYREKVALVLIAYNIGWGHLEDAQNMASRLGHNPNSWLVLRDILPKLENPAWSSLTKWGPARGKETVSFVERTLAYFDLL